MLIVSISARKRHSDWPCSLPKENLHVNPAVRWDLQSRGISKQSNCDPSRDGLVWWLSKAISFLNAWSFRTSNLIKNSFGRPFGTDTKSSVKIDDSPFNRVRISQTSGPTDRRQWILLPVVEGILKVSIPHIGGLVSLHDILGNRPCLTQPDFLCWPQPFELSIIFYWLIRRDYQVIHGIKILVRPFQVEVEAKVEVERA